VIEIRRSVIARPNLSIRADTGVRVCTSMVSGAFKHLIDLKITGKETTDGGIPRGRFLSKHGRRRRFHPHPRSGLLAKAKPSHLSPGAKPEPLVLVSRKTAHRHLSQGIPESRGGRKLLSIIDAVQCRRAAKNIRQRRGMALGQWSAKFRWKAPARITAQRHRQIFPDDYLFKEIRVSAVVRLPSALAMAFSAKGAMMP
jgi:hypothetical protein